MLQFLTRPSSLWPVIHMIVSRTSVRSHFMESTEYFEISPEITIDSKGLIADIGHTSQNTASQIGKDATYFHLFDTPNALQTYQDNIRPFTDYVIAKTIQIMTKRNLLQIPFIFQRNRVIAEIDPLLHKRLSKEDVEMIQKALHSPYSAKAYIWLGTSLTDTEIKAGAFLQQAWYGEHPPWSK